MLRRATCLSLGRQIIRLASEHHKSFSPARCRYCSTLQHKSPLTQTRHQSTAAAAEAVQEPNESGSSLPPESVEPIPPPNVEGQQKTYSPKIHDIVNQIAGLSLLEAAELNELLKSTLNISGAPMMMAGAMPAPAGPKEEEEVKPQKVSFAVKLMHFDSARKVALIKEIKAALPEMNLVQAKKFVEGVPQKVKSDLTQDEAEKLKEALTAAGGEAVVE